MPEANGLSPPYVAAALFCDRVIEGKDGSLTAVRIVDTVAAQVKETFDPAAPLPVPVPTLLVVLRAGELTGKHHLQIRHRPSAGKVLATVSLDILLDGEERGAQAIIEYGVQWLSAGLHWFELELDGRQLTRMPLRISWQRAG